jgi:hypothetical protein
VSSLPIIEHLDVFEDVLRRFISCGVVPMIDQFTLERPEETFDAGVVPAVALAAHAGDETVLIEQTLVARGRLLTAAIRMVQEPRRGDPVRSRHREGPLGQLDG